MNPNGSGSFLPPHLSAQKQRESQSGMSKVCPNGDAKKFFQSFFRANSPKFLRAFDISGRSPKLKSRKVRQETAIDSLFGSPSVPLGWGFVRVDLIDERHGSVIQ